MFNDIKLNMDDEVYQTELKGSNFVKNILFFIEKSLGKKIVCLFVRTVIKTFLIENIKIFIFVLNDGSVVAERWSASLVVKVTHFQGQKTFLIEYVKISIFTWNDGGR